MEREQELTRTEPLDRYGLGGLHPVHIGDVFNEGRYRIVDKLGSGQSATVWVARDQYTNDSVVSLKFLSASETEKSHIELSIFRMIETMNLGHPGRQHVAKLLDHFYHEGPNGIHLCTVMEFVGPTLFDVLDVSPGECMKPNLARHVSRQLLLAVDYLHSIGIVHGDLNHGNILLRLPDPDEYLIFDKPQVREVINTNGFPLGAGYPKYVIEPIQIAEVWEDDVEIFHDIQIIDFGSCKSFTSFLDTRPDSVAHMPIIFTPPEVIFEKPFTKAIDIWTLACVTYTIATGDDLFEGGQRDRRDLIPEMYRAIGASAAPWLMDAIVDALARDVWNTLPPIRFPLWDDRMATLEERVRFNIFFNKKEEDSDEDDSNTESHEEDSIGKNNVEFTELLLNYLKAMLVVDPDKRATTTELLELEFVKDLGTEWLEVSDLYKSDTNSEGEEAQTDEADLSNQMAQMTLRRKRTS
ncbi:kinase-like protein [Aaosphaeria arxii CBS 175.79]|uniref:non-specific serine/threonine protein kinase n=1 Tax=Aaosphaeria arxii CBS 175.79 TaxID=1450172 RepID=A0A6A5XJC4_9PLEO|nr:kinase-like protein [Aaosphaeria arxii CBS 175.79]KAF2012931.1 kinase-like protein [Aaosphaeria arxii CBS 175.79]